MMHPGVSRIQSHVCASKTYVVALPLAWRSPKIAKRLSAVQSRTWPQTLLVIGNCATRWRSGSTTTAVLQNDCVVAYHLWSGDQTASVSGGGTSGGRKGAGVNAGSGVALAGSEETRVTSATGMDMPPGGLMPISGAPQETSQAMKSTYRRRKAKRFAMNEKWSRLPRRAFVSNNSARIVGLSAAELCLAPLFSPCLYAIDFHLLAGLL